jgi:hypothetical protein
LKITCFGPLSLSFISILLMISFEPKLERIDTETEISFSIAELSGFNLFNCSFNWLFSEVAVVSCSFKSNSLFSDCSS